ncbi:MAG: EpsI family protein [Gammaproteobacteria bacterium]|nr:EpsI family protein [Gammaproteobacteria bacterium]
MSNQNDTDVHQNSSEINNTSRNILVFLIVVFIIYWQTVQSLLMRWWVSPTYSHGLLVLPIVIYLIWSNRHKTNSVKSFPRYWLMIPLVGVCAFWWISNVVSIDIGQQVSFVLLLMLAVAVAFGERVLLTLAFPLLYIFVAIPVWNFLEPVLQIITVKFVSVFLAWAGIPHLVEQHFITIPEGKFSVEEVCAGLRFFMAAIAITLLFAYMNLRTRMARVVFVMFGLVGAVVLNWVRVFVVIVAGHLTEMQHWLVHSHVGLGWWMFAGFLIPLFWFGWKLEKRESTVNEDGIAGQKDSIQTSGALQSPRFLSVGLVLLLLTLPPISVAILKYTPGNMGSVSLQAPIAQGEWRGPIDSVGWDIVFPGFDSKILVSYTNDDKSVRLLSVFFKTQESGKELISHKNRLYDEKVWRAVSSGNHYGSNGQFLELELIGLNTNKKRLVWFWYKVGGKHTASRLEAKLMHAVDLLNERRGSSLTAVSYDYGEDIIKARETLDQFIQQVPPIFKIKPGEKA